MNRATDVTKLFLNVIERLRFCYSQSPAEWQRNCYMGVQGGEFHELCMLLAGTTPT